MAKRTMRITDKGAIHYFIGRREVTEKEYQKRGNWSIKPPDYEKGECPGMHPDYTDYRNETDRKTGVRGGRYFHQLARRPGDKSAVFPSRSAAAAEAKRRGYSVEID